VPWGFFVFSFDVLSLLLASLLRGFFCGVACELCAVVCSDERHEGKRLSAYKCSRGFWTVGIGRNLEHNPMSETEKLAIFGKSLGDDVVIRQLMFSALSDADVELLFLNDVTRAEELCFKHLPMDGLNDARKAVFINMVFQMGIGGVLKFKNALRFASLAEFDKCAAAMLDSKWFRLDSPGRAQELADQMLTGEWQ
jgi:lysozyme